MRGFNPIEGRDPKVGEVRWMNITKPVQCTGNGIFYVCLGRKDYVHDRSLTKVKRLAVERMKGMIADVAIPFTRVVVDEDFYFVRFSDHKINRVDPFEFQNDRGEPQRFYTRRNGERFLKPLDEGAREDLEELVEAAKLAIGAVNAWLDARAADDEYLKAQVPEVVFEASGPGD